MVSLRDVADDQCITQEKRSLDAGPMIPDILRRVTECIRHPINKVAFSLSSDSWTIQAIDVEFGGGYTLQY